MGLSVRYRLTLDRPVVTKKGIEINIFILLVNFNRLRFYFNLNIQLRFCAVTVTIPSLLFRIPAPLRS